MTETLLEIPLQNPSIASAISCFMMGTSVPNQVYKIIDWDVSRDYWQGSLTATSARESKGFTVEQQFVLIDCISHLESFSIDQTIGFSGSLICSVKEMHSAFLDQKPLTLKKTDRDTFILQFDGDQILFEGYAVDVKIESSSAMHL